MGDPATGSVHAVAGEYVEFRRPERIAYTWTWEGAPAEMQGSEQTLVTVDFVEEGAWTKVVLVHSGFGSEHARDLHGKAGRAASTTSLAGYSRASLGRETSRDGRPGRDDHPSVRRRRWPDTR